MLVTLISKVLGRMRYEKLATVVLNNLDMNGDVSLIRRKL
jgi:hypothetical protein